MASMIDNPSLQAEFAALFVGGMTRRDLAAHFQVSTDTISRWSRDERVSTIIDKLMREREHAILRLVDAKLQEKLVMHADELDVDDLVKIRRTFAPAGPRPGKDEEKDDADLAVWEELDEGRTLPELPEHTGADWEIPEWEVIDGDD